MRAVNILMDVPRMTRGRQAISLWCLNLSGRSIIQRYLRRLSAEQNIHLSNINRLEASGLRLEWCMLRNSYWRSLAYHQSELSVSMDIEDAVLALPTNVSCDQPSHSGVP
jgi:hypothetical protein